MYNVITICILRIATSFILPSFLIQKQLALNIIRNREVNEYKYNNYVNRELFLKHMNNKVQSLSRNVDGYDSFTESDKHQPEISANVEKCLYFLSDSFRDNSFSSSKLP